MPAGAFHGRRVHRIPLQLGCPVCGESDPLTFDSPELKPIRTCWACGASLADPAVNCSNVRGHEPVIRAALARKRIAFRMIRCSRNDPASSEWISSMTSILTSSWR